MINYVTGFVFSEDLKHVVLLEKQTPAWQKGLFNGVGRKIENGESSTHAMVRECEEETGMLITENNWTCYAHLTELVQTRSDISI